MELRLALLALLPDGGMPRSGLELVSGRDGGGRQTKIFPGGPAEAGAECGVEGDVRYVLQTEQDGDNCFRREAASTSNGGRKALGVVQPPADGVDGEGEETYEGDADVREVDKGQTALTQTRRRCMAVACALKWQAMQHPSSRL